LIFISPFKSPVFPVPVNKCLQISDIFVECRTLYFITSFTFSVLAGATVQNIAAAGTAMAPSGNGELAIPAEAASTLWKSHAKTNQFQKPSNKTRE
jgi:hypothetical protein